MNRTAWTMTLVLAVILVEAARAGGAEGPPGRFAQLRAPYPPNIILIQANLLSPEDLGCYGSTNAATPNIDRLAAEGVRFTHFYSASPQTAPAQASLLTGFHTGHLPLVLAVPLPREKPTLPELLKSAGFRTGGVGCWALGLPESASVPIRRGFDDWVGYLEPDKFPDYYAASYWRNERSVETSVFLPNLFDVVRSNYVRVTKYFPFFLYDAINLPGPETVQHQRKAPPSRTVRLQQLDRQVGALMQQLQTLDLDSVTALILTSDRPRPSSSNPAPRLAEHDLRVPLLVRYPSKFKPAVADLPCASYDLFPTILQMVQTNALPATDGLSLLPTLLGQKQKPHDYLYWKTVGESRVDEAIRTADWHATRVTEMTPARGGTNEPTRMPATPLDEVLGAFDRARQD